MSIITTTSTAISLLKRLREISKNIEEAEFNNVLADLANELADIKIEAASLKEKMASLIEENASLKKVKSTTEKPSGVKWGCYIFEDPEMLYCTACWDSKKQKSLTSRATSKHRLCGVCKAVNG
jgi:hypothetical protein